MTPFALAIAVFGALLTPQIAVAQSQTTVLEAPKASRPGAEFHAPSATSPAARILQEIQDHQEALANLEYLCDVIGPRLTGSKRLIKAHAWAESKLKGYGLTVLPREAYAFGLPWTRGRERARLLSHGRSSLTLAQIGWTPGTQGVIQGEVIDLGGDVDEALARVGHLKGKLLFLSGDRYHSKDDSAETKAKRERVREAIREEGLAALLTVSDRKDGLLSMDGSPEGTGWLPVQKVPAAILTAESGGLLKRLLARREPVQLELELGGALGTTPVQAYNTLAELKGSEKPEEIVLLGAHLDSWDLGTGATDNGTGVVAIMEALRAIQASGLKPRRTIRIALFSGEEQEFYGSTHYVKTHAAELAHHQAVLINDLGSGRVRGFALQNREDLRPFMAMAIAPLQELGVKDLPLEGSGDSDHAPFLASGVPAFFCVQELADYFSVTHHGQADTFEHVKPEDLLQGTGAMAVTAWELANMAARLPHKPLKAEPAY